jgi:hypothetical protein
MQATPRGDIDPGRRKTLRTMADWKKDQYHKAQYDT